MSYSGSNRETEVKTLLDVKVNTNLFERESFAWRILSFLNLIIFVFAALSGTYFLNRYNEASKYLLLIENFDGKQVLIVLAWIFYLGALINLLGAWHTNNSLYKTRRGRLKYTVWSYAVWLLFYILVVFYSLYVSSMAFVKASTAFKPGFRMKMLEYVKEDKEREMIDHVQKRMQCCGSHDMNEWFKMSWDKAIFHRFSVPASCCDYVNYPKDDCVTTARTQSHISSMTIWRHACSERMEAAYKSSIHATFSLQAILLGSEIVCFILVAFNMHLARSYEKVVVDERMRYLRSVAEKLRREEI